MPDFNLEAADEELIDGLVTYYTEKRGTVQGFLDSLHAFVSAASAEQPLKDLIHSVKRRLKDPKHLKDKLVRKLQECREGRINFGITQDNLFANINDLGGYRILHLHTRQVEQIHPRLLKVFEDANFDLHEAPSAHIWDQETAGYFKLIGIDASFKPTLYSSVHYVLRARAKIAVTCEVQVRTLADEIWGEIDHKINYPIPHESLACREQIKALARVASSCSRLADSIMATHEEWKAKKMSK